MYLYKIIKLISFFLLIVSWAFALPPKFKNSPDVSLVQKEVESILDINLRQIEGCADCVIKSHGQKVKLPSFTGHFDNDGADCTDFIKEDGSYGPLGQTISDYLSRDDVGIFLSDAVPGMSTSPQVCPKWSSLSKEERIHFWVWTMASIAWGEARCVATVRNVNATNGVGVGLFQLDERRGDRYWRGDHCAVKSVSNANANTLCALDIMSELLKGRQGVYKSNGKIYSNSSSYWEHLRRSNGGNMGALIKHHPLCH